MCGSVSDDHDRGLGDHELPQAPQKNGRGFGKASGDRRGFVISPEALDGLLEIGSVIELGVTNDGLQDGSQIYIRIFRIGGESQGELVQLLARFGANLPARCPCLWS